MAFDESDFFLFLGSADSESATTRLRASGAYYRKKLLNSRPENWVEITSMVTSPRNLGTLVKLTGTDYNTICRDTHAAVAKLLLDAFVGRPHAIFVHEAVFLTDQQRKDAEPLDTSRAEYLAAPLVFDDDDDDDDWFGLIKDEPFPVVSEEVREKVNTMLRDRALNVLPYRTNVERSIMAGVFLDDHERHLLFRFYVPSGRLYGQEFEALLGLFREWLTQTGHQGVRQEGYSTRAGQVFEFFSAEGVSSGGLAAYLEEFSRFLEDCSSRPEAAAQQLTRGGIDPTAAGRIVNRFATQVRRLNLDLKQRREERVLALKHQLENLSLEIEGLRGAQLESILNELIPDETPASVMLPTGPRFGIPRGSSGLVDQDNVVASGLTVNNYQQQFIHQVQGSVIQNLQGTVNLAPEARQLLELVAEYGGQERAQLESAVHELEDDGARPIDRVAARGRLKRFLADVGNRGLGIGLAVLQKYLEHKIGIS